MRNKTSNKLMSNTLVISLVVFLIGQLFQIQHFPYGRLISIIGLGFYLILSILEIDRLKKIILKLEKDKIVVD